MTSEAAALQPDRHASGPTPALAAKQAGLQQLRQQLASYQSPLGAPQDQRLATGWLALDEALGGGLMPAALNEVAASGSGTGIIEALLKAFLVPQSQSQGAGFWAWISAESYPYPPALQQLGFALERWLILRPRQLDEELWAIEQVLRSGLCRGLVIQRPKQRRSAMDSALRRFQLAAREGQTTVLLLSRPADLQQPSPAPLRLFAEALTSPDRRRRVKIDVVKTRGSAFSEPVLLEWSHDALDEPPISRTLNREFDRSPTHSKPTGLRALPA